MKRILRKLINMAAVTAIVATTVLATDLDNQDSKDYDVKVRTGAGSTTNYTIYHGSTKLNICSGPCEIEVVGVGTVKVTGKEKVVIKNGQLSVE